MRRFRWVRGVVVVGLAGALVGVVPSGASAMPARSRCRPTAVVTNANGTVSTIDVKTKTTHPTDLGVGPAPIGVAVTPDGSTVFFASNLSDSVSTIDVASRTPELPHIEVGSLPGGVAITPCRR